MIKWLNNLKSDIGQPQHSQLWHYAEILDVIAKYLESTERTGEWKHEGDCGITRCGQCGWSIEECIEWNYCPNCGAKMGNI